MIDDPESPDAAPVQEPERLDVTPRTPTQGRSGAGRGRGRGRTYAAVGALAVVLVALGLVISNGLRDASTFFYNVDEVVAKQHALQGERIRVQGNVVDGSVHKTDDGVRFLLRFDGKQITVSHIGDPPELFGPKIPVVLEGTLDGATFHSDTILVRHDSTYDEKNPGRVRDAERDATTTTVAGPVLGGASG
ncbi:MAG: cytochrome c maturation protein CcmE [Actinobacteria bacterium]|nr:cytochrome c maturation protein CcmE [Actinomycetota bacterium]